MFFSGTLIASVANFILIGILGTHDEGARWEDGAGAGVAVSGVFRVCSLIAALSAPCSLMSPITCP